MPDIKPLSAAEILDRNHSWFIELGHGPSKLGHGGCAYRGDRGTRCGIGCVIPTDLYDPLMDTGPQNSITFVLERFPNLQKLFAGVDVGFLVELQKAHDSLSNNWSTSAYSDRLWQLANQFNIDWSPPDD